MYLKCVGSVKIRNRVTPPKTNIQKENSINYNNICFLNHINHSDILIIGGDLSEC